MPAYTSAKHNAVQQWSASHFLPFKHSESDYRELLMTKMSDLNTSSNNHQLVAGMKAYENFCVNDNGTPINPTKQLPQSPVDLRSRGMNGDDSSVYPNSPISWQDHQQALQSLRLELEERKRNESQLINLVHVLKQQQQSLFNRDFDQVNGPSMTADGLPSAPSSDGIVESVKDGHIKRLGREITVLKANLHDTENKLSIAQKERDSALQQVASLSALQTDSDRRATFLQRQVAEMLMNGEKQQAEISTLKESVQRLSKENQSLKEAATVISSRQPTSLGASSGGSSVAGCSQELDYLHKVVDTLKATVQEQHSKLCSLRSLQDKFNQAASTLGGHIKAQSFPIVSSSSVSRATPASLAADTLRPKGRPVMTHDTSEWSIDGGSPNVEGLSRLGVCAIATNNNNTNLGVSNNMGVSPRENQAVQEEETLNALETVMEKLKLADDKPISGVDICGKSRSEAVDIAEYLVAPENNFKLTPQNKPFDPPGSGSVTCGLQASTKKVSAGKPFSQVIASNRTDIPTSTVPSFSGTRPLSKSEVIGVSSGLGRPSVSRSSSTYVVPGALLNAAAGEQLQANLRRYNNQFISEGMSTSDADGITASDILVPGFRMSRLGGAGLPLAAPQRPRLVQPQFVYEAEVEDSPGAFPGEGRPNYQQKQQQYLPPSVTSSSVFTPQPPPAQHQARAPPSTSPLATYQTASAAVTSNREGMHVLNKHMMGGGNVIYQQSPSQFLLPQQQMLLGGGATSASSPQLVNFPNQTLISRGSQQKPQTTNLSSPVDNLAQALYSNAPRQIPSQQLDPSGPRVNSDRTCPVCSRDFSHVPMEDFQAHVYECFDEAGPETMKAPAEEKSSPRGKGGGTDRTCPVCNTGFERSVPQAEFERHVHSHFGEEGFEIVS